MDYPPLGGKPFSGDDGGAVSQYLGTWTIINTPVDALPDLSDVQVIVKTSYPGQAPQIVEKSGDLSADHHHAVGTGAKTVRGFSQFGDSYVYVIFEDGTDPYWALARTGVPQPGSGKIAGWR
jgi:Cu/Ag efflux pump CusA